MSCSGFLFQFIFGLINIVFLLIGVALIVITSVFKWSKISSLKEISALETVFKLTQIDAVTIALLCIGGFIVFLSLIGLIGVCYANRCFLIMYVIITVILFMAHVAALIALLAMAPRIEKQYRASLDSMMDDLNARKNQNDFEDKCKVMNVLSAFFTCCGSKGPQDFNSDTDRNLCCKNGGFLKQAGCADASVNFIKYYSTYFLIIPTCVIDFIELLAIVSVALMIRNLNQLNQRPIRFSSIY
jgi:hypothetical protein